MSESHQQQRYRVIDRLASGGMAEVFVAESAGIEGFKKRVAIKRVLPHLSEKKRFISMFLDEARLGAHLSHSNCVQTFDIGVGDNAYFIVMEYVDGADLKAVVDYLRTAGRSFPVEIAVLIAVRICEGLTYAHELVGTDDKPLHIVHRDMSPPNILITKFGEVKIVDFGLAKASSQLEKSEPGIIKGKFSYLSPEAALGEEVDHRTDIFAVGIILWELLAGKRLFLGDTDFATVKQVQQANVPALAAQRKDVPEELDRIIRRALAKDMNVRYSSARDLGRDLTSFLYRYGKPVSSFDIAELVRGAMAVRKKATPNKASIIDKLIEEALFEFTSLQDGKGGSPAQATAPKPDEPLKLGFEDIGNWADEMSSVPAAKPTREEINLRQTISGIQIGNLSALEDAGSPEPPLTGSGASSSAPPPPGPPSDLAPRQSVPQVPSYLAGGAGGPTSGPAAKGGGGGGAIKAVLVVVVIAVLAVGGAWFAGLIPH
jgi:serine/threonine-protein kinase